jgi:hypothetical protein
MSRQQGDTDMKKYSKRELRAIGFQIADEILTRAEKYKALGMDHAKAVNKAMEDMAA